MLPGTVLVSTPLLFAFTTFMLIQSIGASCPCTNLDWCKPIVWNVTRKEVFAFSTVHTEARWRQYDWSKITTVVQFGNINPLLVCLAHSHNARVVVKTERLDVATMTNAKLRKLWIQKQVKIVQDNIFDGVNFDFEGPILKNQTNIRNAYTLTINETAQALKAINKHYQISVDFAWTPNVDSRFYDYRAIGEVSDLLFVMAYDEQSQIYGECLAMPNSGLPRAVQGLDEYLKNPLYKLDPKKVVLGVPWYGYIYPCISLTGDKCTIKKVPFRGVACSDAAGKQYSYGSILNLMRTLPGKPHWNSTTSTPYISYVNGLTNTAYQIQYDNPASLSLKYALVEKYGLLGVGMWNIDLLDYSNTKAGELCRRDMFGALP